MTPRRLAALPDRSHLIGRQFGGSGGRRNLVPLFSDVNRQIMTQYEEMVREAVVDRRDVVYYKVTPSYDGANPVPIGVTIEAKGATIDLYISILNRPISNKK